MFVCVCVQDHKLDWAKKNISFNTQRFRPTGIKKFQCQYGPHYYKPKQRKTERLMLQMTKKKRLPCSNHAVKENEVFPQYSLKEENFQTLSGFVQRNLRASKLKELSDAIRRLRL